MSLQITAEDKTLTKNYWLKFERNEIFLLIGYFFYGIAFANYEPYAPVWLSQIFEEDLFLIIGFVVVIPNIVVALGTPFWGMLADKFGAKKFVLLGIFSFGLLFFSLIFTMNSLYFLIAILIGYLFGAANTSNFFALTSKSINKPKEIIFAKQTITISSAFVIFSPLAGWIYDTFSNSMTIQLIIAASAILISLVLIMFVKTEKPNNEQQFAQEEKPKAGLTILPFVFIGVMFLTFFFQSGAGFWAYSSIYFLDELAIDGIYFSIFIIVKTALAVPLSLLLGRVKKKKSMGIIIISFLIYFLFVYVLMTIFPTNWILLIIIYSIPMYPLYNVFLYSLTAMYSNEERRGTAFGIFNSIGTAGYVAGILILGAFADYSSLGIFVMFRVSIVISLIALIIALLMHFLAFRKDFHNSLTADGKEEQEQIV